MMMMRCVLAITIAIVTAATARAADDAKSIRSLRVLYVGTAGTDRARAYARFLADRFTLLEAADRDRFDPESAKAADVVILDWSQSDAQKPGPGRDPSGRFRAPQSPLGDRARWSRPTVLLGSAGLLLAEAWEVHGGCG
jgi:hypothetical protein